MRTIAFICTLALCMSVCAQQVKVDTLQVGQNRYQKRYTSSFVYIKRISQEKILPNQDLWKEYCDVLSVSGNPQKTVDKYASPYIKNGQVLIDLELAHNMQGELVYAEYSYEREYDTIPIEVIDKIDTELRETLKITVRQYRKDPEQRVHNITLTMIVVAGQKRNE